jgi:hypothetical protein
MSRFFSRLVTKHKEETFPVVIRIHEIEILTYSKLGNLYVELERGSQVATSPVLGSMDSFNRIVKCNHVFESSSVFYKNEEKSVYLEKEAKLRIWAQSGEIKGTYPMKIATATVDLSKFIMKDERNFGLKLISPNAGNMLVGRMIADIRVGTFKLPEPEVVKEETKQEAETSSLPENFFRRVMELERNIDKLKE